MNHRRRVTITGFIIGIVLFVALNIALLLKGHLKEDQSFFVFEAAFFTYLILLMIAAILKSKMLIFSCLTFYIAFFIEIFNQEYAFLSNINANIITQLLTLLSLILFVISYYRQSLLLKKNTVLNNIFNHHNDVLYIEINTKADSVNLSFSKKFKQSYGVNEELQKVRMDEFLTYIHPEDQQNLNFENYNGLLDVSFIKIRFRLPEMREYSYLLINGFQEVEENLICLAYDISNYEVMTQSLTRKTKEASKLDALINKTFENTKDLIGVFDLKGKIIFASKCFAELYNRHKSVIGLNLLELNELYGHHDKTWFHELLKKQSYQTRTHDVREGVENWIQWHMEVIMDGNGKPEMIISTGYDITEVMILNRDLEYQSRHDSQTGFLNREGLFSALFNIQDFSKAYCFYIGLRNFSAINDYYGMAIGDQIIKKIATEFLQYRKKRSLIGRMMGYQFVLILFDPTPEEVNTTLKELERTVLRVYHVGNISTQVNKNIGYAVYPKDSKNMINLITLAGVAMKEAATSEHNVIVKYERVLSDRLNDKIKVATKLRDAIDRGEIDIHFQNIIDVKNKEVNYVEALARWTDREMGYIPPDYFIKMAVESNLIDYLEDYLVATAISKYRKLHQIPKYKKALLALNLSPSVLLRDGFSNFLDSCLMKNGLSSSDICIEVSENTFINNLDLCNYFIRIYKEKGFKIAIDDFGREYSSLAVLDHIDYDIIKIDGTFVNNLDSDKNRAIIKMIIEIAQMGRKTIIAEGVESGKASEAMKSFECFLQQGYYFHRPEKLV